MEKKLHDGYLAYDRIIGDIEAHRRMLSDTRIEATAQESRELAGLGKQKFNFTFRKQEFLKVWHLKIFF